MLEDFSTVKLGASKPAVASGSAQTIPTPKPEAPKATTQGADDDNFSEEDFAKQLQEGMADLLGELGKSVRRNIFRQPHCKHNTNLLIA